MTGTSFNPDKTVKTGKRYIVSLILPSVATSIAAGTNSAPTFSLSDFFSLKSIKGDNIITIGDYCICDTPLERVDFPKATTIGNRAFFLCSLQSISFPLVTTIGEYAFDSCSLLQSASFPLVTTIGEYAFHSCSKLSSLSIPKVTRIETYAFATGSTGLTITMGPTAPTLAIHVAVLSGQTVKVKVPIGATGYTPFSGTSVTVSGSDSTVNWANGLRGAGWTGSAFASSGGYVRSGVTVIIEQQ